MQESFQAEELLMQMKKVSIELEVRLERALRHGDMSGVQVYFAVYLLRHHPGGTYITELSREMGISKATLSVLVKRLREKGYLYFEQQAGDIRRKRIMPAGKLKEEQDLLLEKVINLENEVCGGLDSMEKEQLYILEQKILKQLE